MSVLSIRNIPDDVARALKRLAGARGQSMESLAREALVTLARPTVQQQETEFWNELRTSLGPGDADSLEQALTSLRDDGYTPPDLS
jgi:plasmid stability protein